MNAIREQGRAAAAKKEEAAHISRAWSIARSLLLLGLMVLLFRSGGLQAAGITWQELEPGLELTKIKTSPESAHEDLVMLRIDQDRYELSLLSASEQDSQRLTMHDWVHEHDLLAAINASMFWTDQRTSTGFMKNFEHINNTNIHPQYNAFLVFHPKSPELPAVRMVDRINTRDWEDILDNYHTVIQNYRMISSRQDNVWEEKSKSFSVAAVGMTKNRDILFIMSFVPRMIHELNELLLELPVQLKMCMFVEGGSTAGMYVRAGGVDQGWHGTANNSLWSERSMSFVRIPNVLGVVKRR